MGEGGINGYTDKKNGSASHGKGTQGTKNDSIWAGNDWSGSNKWDDSTWKEDLNVKMDKNNHNHHEKGNKDRENRGAN